MLNYVSHSDYDRRKSIEQIGELPYFSKKKMKEKYPKAGYLLVGAVGQGVDEKAGVFRVGSEDKAYYTLHFSKIWYAIYGYIDCGNNQYIAVIKKAKARNISLTVLYVLGIVLALWMMQANQKNSLDPNAKKYSPSIENIVATDADHIALPGYDDIRMVAGSDMAYLALWNPEGNPCLFKFTLIKDGEALFQSGMIEPGKAVTEVKLTKTIPKGIHDAILKIQTFAIDDPNIELNGGEVLIKLVGLEQEATK